MRRRAVLTLFLAALACSAGCVDLVLTTETGDVRNATVTHVVDGDTVDVRFADGSTDRVRLLGVDTPEVHVETEPEHFAGVPDTDAGHACLRRAGENASAFVERRIADDRVRVETDPTADRRGGYDRLLAYVHHDGRNLNYVLLDLDRDAWLYVSQRYLGQEAVAGETGSSTMPHKVNPIDFENSEGNLSKANSDLGFLEDSVTTSRLQRDLSDSTVKRNIGAAFAHCLIGYSKCQNGLEKVAPNEQVMRDELAATPEIIGEAVQTILRREGHTDAYERVKALTRGQNVTIENFHELFADLDVPSEVRAELQSLTPAGYTGVASDLVDRLVD